MDHGKRTLNTANNRTWPKRKFEARKMRREPTAAEALLWQHLRRNQAGGRFRRQHTIGDFIVDFVCLKSRLVVEVDGDIHLDPDRHSRDLSRDAYLSAAGFTVVRYTNEQVMHDLDGVLIDIRRHLPR